MSESTKLELVWTARVLWVHSQDETTDIIAQLLVKNFEIVLGKHFMHFNDMQSALNHVKLEK